MSAASTKSGGTFAAASPLAPPLGLALVLGTTLFLPAEMNPAASTALALVVVAALLGMVAAQGFRPLGRAAAWALGAALALALLLSVRAVFARSPAVSVWGTLEQHNGAILWLTATALAAATAHLAEKKALRLTLSLVALAGAVYAASAFIEALTVGQRDWGSAAGPFENSSSLGQFLAVAFGCSIAWALGERTVGRRVAAWVCAGAAGGGILLASSRAGLLGVIAGAAVAVALYAGRRSSAARRAVALGAPVGALAITWAAVSAANGAFGPSAVRVVGGLGTDRDAIWRSAWLAARQAPLIGRGPEQFSAWISWSLQRGSVLFTGTYDPHNWVLGAVIAVGFVGLAALVAVLVTGLYALADSIAVTRGALPLVAATGGLVALPASALVTWFTPSAVFAAAVVFGCIVGATAPPEARRTGHIARLAAAIGALLIVGLLVWAWPAVKAEWRFVAGGAEESLSTSELARLWETWPDPAYAALAAGKGAGAGGRGVAEARALADDVAAQRTWHVDAALASLFAYQASSAMGDDTWNAYRKTIDQGRLADPASGMWDTLGALEAERLGRDAEARAYARGALTHVLGEEARAEMERVLGR